MSQKKERAGPSAPVKAYLVAYNLFSAAGWAYNLSLMLKSLAAGDSALEAWNQSGHVLTIVQSLAVMEIFHSMFKLVSSPWLTTFIQVMSRLIVLWGYTIPFSHQHWSFYLLAISWSTVEVPRYLFYVWQLLFPSTPAPAPLFFLRYSLFAVLYPTGISGEILQLWNSMAYWKDTFNLWRIASYVLLFTLYPPLSPFMYMHMVKQRKQQYKKRAEALNPALVPAKPAEVGLVFPKDKTTGEVSTTQTGKEIFATSVQNISQVEYETVLKERNWRFGYAKHVVKNVELSVKSKDNAVKIAQAGLDYCYKNFRFIRDGKESSLEEAMTLYPGKFIEGKMVGKKAPNTAGIAVPYNGKNLSGNELKAQLDKWVKYGTIEPSCGAAIQWASENCKDLSAYTFVLLGAGSAMGPLQMLLSLNATIVAIDLDRPPIWERILKMVENSASTVYFPLKSEPTSQSIEDIAKVAGGNLMAQTPEVARFVSEVAPGKELVIGVYTYLDGALHVQVSLAADAVIKTAIDAGRKVIPAYLCSPTDVFAQHKESYDAAKENRAKATWWQKLITMLPLGKHGLKPNGIDAGNGNYIVNGLVIDQGPNYALAKRVQHWRAILVSAAGGMVSSNIAPSTRTISVTSNKSFAIAYNGMASFKPFEITEQATSNAVMASVLIHDVVNQAKSPKNPQSAEAKAVGVDQNPHLLFAQGAFHGGVWRCGYSINSAGPFFFLIGLLKEYPYVPPVIAAALGGLFFQGLPLELP